MGMTDHEVEMLREARQHFPDRHPALADQRHGDGAACQPRRARRAGSAGVHHRRSRTVVGQHPGARGTACQHHGRRHASRCRRRARSGKIIRIGRTVDPNTQSTIAVAEIDSNNGAVRPGLAVDRFGPHCRRTARSEWSVPPAAVVRHRDRSWVFVRSHGRLQGAPGTGRRGKSARRVDPRHFRAERPGRRARHTCLRCCPTPRRQSTRRTEPMLAT